MNVYSKCKCSIYSHDIEVELALKVQNKLNTMNLQYLSTAVQGNGLGYMWLVEVNVNRGAPRMRKRLRTEVWETQILGGRGRGDKGKL